MARARNIKPAFFTNDDLVELPFETRLLFIGLWTIADREGRLEDRPKRIKMEVFPADAVDVETCLIQLASTGMLVRYQVEGVRYIEIVNFLKHQRPHGQEKESEIPPFQGDLQPRYEQVTTKVVLTDTQGNNQYALIPDTPLSDTGYLNADCGRGAANADTPTPRPKRATQVPDDFAVTEKLEQWGAAQDPPFAVSAMRVEVPQFVDYYQAKGETRKDWDASFRTWMRNSRKWQKPKPTPPDSGGRITSIDQLFADGDTDEPTGYAEDFSNPSTRMATEWPRQTGDTGVDVSAGRDGFRAIAGGRS